MADSGEGAANRAEMDVDLPSRSSDAGGLHACVVANGRESNSSTPAAAAKPKRGRQVGSKNTPRTGLDDLEDKTLCQVCRDVGLTWIDRAQAIAGIHLQSGSSAKSPKTNLDDLKEDTLALICADRSLASSGNRADLIARILGRGGGGLTSEDNKRGDASEPDRSAEMDVDLFVSSDGGGPRCSSSSLKYSGGGSSGRGSASDHDSISVSEDDKLLGRPGPTGGGERGSRGGGGKGEGGGIAGQDMAESGEGSPGIQKKTKRAAGGAKDYKNGDFIIFVNRLAVVRDDQKLQETKKRDGGDKKPKPSSPWTALRPGDEKYGKVWDDPEHFAWECLKGEREGGDKKRSIKIDRHDDSGPVDLYPKIPREKKDSTVEKQRVANERAVGDGTPCDYACVFPS
jgi:hypothetical protein